VLYAAQRREVLHGIRLMWGLYSLRMCSNYDEITDEDRLLKGFGVSYSSEKEMLREAAKRKQKFSEVTFHFHATLA